MKKLSKDMEAHGVKVLHSEEELKASGRRTGDYPLSWCSKENL